MGHDPCLGRSQTAYDVQMRFRGALTSAALLSTTGLLAFAAPSVSAATIPTPSLVSAAVVTPTVVNTSAAPREVAVRVGLKATPTAVITDIRLTFFRHLPGDVKANIVVFGASNHIAANAYRECDAQHHAISPAAGDTTMCLVSGSMASGVFELRDLLPQWANSGTYALDRVEVRDSLGRRLDLDYATLTGRHLSPSFTQSGQGDSTPPVLVSTQMMNGTVNSSAGGAIIALRVHATDDQSGMYLLSARFRRAVTSNGTTTYQNPELVSSAFAGRTCPSASAVSQLVGQFGYVCRESGTKLDGTYLAYFLVKRWSAQGTYQLTNLSLVDAAQNRLDDIDVDLANANASATFIQLGIGDTTGPTAVGITTVTTRVSAKSGKYEPVIKIRARDDVSGVKQIWVDYKSAAKPTAAPIIFTTTDIPCTVASAVNHCRYSGSATDGVWRIHALASTTVPKGSWSLWRIRILDNAGNLSVLTGAALTSAHISSSFTLA